MPIYEYQCTSCGKRLEMLKKVSDPPETICPDCTTPTLQKLVSAAGFRLKGTGWYVTDFKNKTENKPGSKPTPDKATAGNSDKSEAKETKAASSAAEAPAATPSPANSGSGSE